MPFERYTPNPTARSNEPAVTITQQSRIKLSAQAVQLLADATHVHLLWDRVARLLGIEPAPPSSPDSVKLGLNRGGGTREIARKDFVDMLGLDLTAARRWSAYLNDDGVLCADLSAPGDIVSSNRASVPARVSTARIPTRTPRNPARGYGRF